jgi:hypothetical protein
MCCWAEASSYYIHCSLVVVSKAITTFHLVKAVHLQKLKFCANNTLVSPNTNKTSVKH